MSLPTTHPLRAYEVGGCVRDSFLGVHSKDIDLAVEVASFATLREWLLTHRFDIFEERPQFLTIQARFPKSPDPSLAAVLPRMSDMARTTVDFVMCRADGDYTDGRRPDEVVAGTIFDDLARRDFTVNAIARTVDGTILDPHDGRADLHSSVLRAVGDPAERLREDSLRALRAVRFGSTKGLYLDPALLAVLRSDWLPGLLANAHENRRRDELHKAFRADTRGTLALLAELGPAFTDAALGDALWLKPTSER